MSADYDSLFKSGPDDGKPGPPVDPAESGSSSAPPVTPPAPGPGSPPPVLDPATSGPHQPVDVSAPPAPPVGASRHAVQSATEQTDETPKPQLPPGMPVRQAPQAWPTPNPAARRNIESWDQAAAPATAFDKPDSAAAPMTRPVPPPPATEHFTEGRTEVVSVWPLMDALAASQGQNSAAQIGSHRAIDALSHVGVKTAVKAPSQRGWRHVLYLMTRINLGLSPDEVYELDLMTRVRRTARDSYQIGVLGLKGGVGKTAVTVALGSVLSKVRGDRILAIDADPDGGNLTDRSGKQSAASVMDLLADKNLARYNDIRAYTSMNASNLEVLASQEYSVARRAFAAEDWEGATSVVSRYYNLVLADCGAGLFHPATRSVLSTVSGLVIVASASLDGARQAAITLDWLRQNGYQDLLARSCVVINHVTPGKPNIDVKDLVAQFERHIPEGRVIVLPWDKHIAAGTEISLDLLDDTFQRRILELAAALSDDFERIDRR